MLEANLADMSVMMFFGNYNRNSTTYVCSNGYALPPRANFEVSFIAEVTLFFAAPKYLYRR